MIPPITIKDPPSPSILVLFSESMELEMEIPPPIIINMPVIINIIPSSLYGGFLEMKNAINDKIIGGKPNPIPRVIASNGKKPSPAPPPPTSTSIP